MSLLHKWFLLLLIIGLAPTLTSAQDEEPPILLVNASFEDLPKCCEAPTGWYNCGKSEESPPDIQPGFFQVNKTADQGQTYLGLVTRDNDTWEGVGQRLSRPLESNKCYDFSLALCRSELYLSLSRTTGEQVNYATPAKLRIWGGNGYCDKHELLAETSVIVNTRWLNYNFKLQPKNGNYSFILLEAYYKTPILFPTNGNILVDNASPISLCPKDKVAAIQTPPRPIPTNTGTGRPPTVKVPTKPTSTPSDDKMDRTKIKKGDIIRLDRIYFDANQYEIKDASVPSLEELYVFLRDNPDVDVEIGGHTNNRASTTYADELSANRAKAVAGWLVQRGIPAARVQSKGYGKRYPIQTNETVEGRKANQRVEIKILNING
ncbi:MAG: OmpA family protein [Lewinellaceae bacterium]|nr:OmpA family protein [Lewinellaceae bacterium]